MELKNNTILITGGTGGFGFDKDQGLTFGVQAVV